jgi:hypothetical protein
MSDAQAARLQEQVRALQDSIADYERKQTEENYAVVVSRGRDLRHHAESLGLPPPPTWSADLPAWLREVFDEIPQPKPAANPYRKKDVNARMLEKMLKDTESGTKECHGWTCKQWAQELRCSAVAVIATATWKKLEKDRNLLKSERSRDRRGRGVGRRKDEYAQDRD